MANSTSQPNAEQRSSSPTVTVACKIGVPWIEFEVCEPREIDENTQTGSRKVKMWMRTGEKVRIRGTAYPRGQAPDGFPEKPDLERGYALTPNVPRVTWERIVEQQAKADYFRSGMIFHFDNINDIRAKAKDHEATLSGLEPIQRTKTEIIDPRMSKSSRSDLSNIQPGVRA